MRLAAGGGISCIHPPTKGRARRERGIIIDFRVVVGWLKEEGSGGISSAGGGVWGVTIRKHRECHPQGKRMTNTLDRRQTQPLLYSSLIQFLSTLTLC